MAADQTDGRQRSWFAASGTASRWGFRPRWPPELDYDTGGRPVLARPGARLNVFKLARPVFCVTLLRTLMLRDTVLTSCVK